MPLIELSISFLRLSRSQFLESWGIVPQTLVLPLRLFLVLKIGQFLLQIEVLMLLLAGLTFEKEYLMFKILNLIFLPLNLSFLPFHRITRILHFIIEEVLIIFVSQLSSKCF